MANQLVPSSSSMDETVLRCGWAGCGAGVFKGEVKEGVEVRAAAAGGIAAGGAGGVAGACGAAGGVMVLGGIAGVTAGGAGFGAVGVGGCATGAAGFGSTGVEGAGATVLGGAATGGAAMGIVGNARGTGVLGVGAGGIGVGAGGEAVAVDGAAETGFSATAGAGWAGIAAPASFACSSPTARCNFKRSRVDSSASSLSWRRCLDPCTDKTISQTGRTNRKKP